MLDSYPSIYAVGHRAVRDIFDGPVYVQEKVDGSQISFGVDFDGELHIRSKGAVVNVDAPEGMFAKAVASIQYRFGALTPGWTYRGEYLAKPKHNALAYDRVPRGHIALFDINTGLESYLLPSRVDHHAFLLDFDVVPTLYCGDTDASKLDDFLKRESFLGGQFIEGVVIKPLAYDRFGADKKCLLAKYVSPAFKEVHQREWSASNPSPGDFVQRLIADYRTDARWAKAVQHAAEEGALVNGPQDIGGLLGRVQADVVTECADEIASKLLKHFLPQIKRGVIAGLPEWYKARLAEGGA